MTNYRDPDYKGPNWDYDPEAKIGYFAIDMTRVSARTQRLQAEFTTVLVDYDENDNVIGVEVMW